MRFFNKNYIFLRNSIFIKFLSYLEYFFLSNSIMIGLVFFFMIIIAIGNANPAFGQKIGFAIEFFSNIFSIRTPEKFINTIILLFLTIPPLIGYLASFIFKRSHKKFNFGYRLLIIETVYIFLITITTIVFYFYNRDFGFIGFLISIPISIFGLIFYSLSYYCGFLKDKLREKTYNNFYSGPK